MGFCSRCEISVQECLVTSCTFREPWAGDEGLGTKPAPGGAACGAVQGEWTGARPQTQAQGQGPKVDGEGTGSDNGDRTRQYGVGGLQRAGKRGGVM